jgi:hypothetical protein
MQAGKSGRTRVPEQCFQKQCSNAPLLPGISNQDRELGAAHVVVNDVARNTCLALFPVDRRHSDKSHLVLVIDAREVMNFLQRQTSTAEKPLPSALARYSLKE